MDAETYESKDQRLHDEIVAFAVYMLPTSQEVTARQNIIKRIESVLLRRFRGGKVHVYGSVSTNLCLPTGDIDLVVETKDVESQEDKKSALFQLRSMLQRDGIAGNIQIAPKARVPVMSMVTFPETGSFNVDITINGTEGVQAIDIVKDYLQRMPALRPLILVAKALLQQHNLHSAATSGLSSYATTCMVVSFLQLNPMEAPAEDLDDPIRSESLGRLLIGFLKYYADDFPYDSSYVSVTEKATPLKKDKGWEECQFAVQCLIHPDNNISKGTGKLRQIRQVFQEAHAALQGAEIEKTNNNILGTIVRLSQETIDYRASIVRVAKAMEDRNQSVTAARRPYQPPAAQRHSPPGGYSDYLHSYRS
ncbi:Nucleotidyltransferase, partial [Artomyces pyxidatus]